MEESNNTARFARIRKLASKRYFIVVVFLVFTVTAIISITPFYVRYRTGEEGFDNRKGMIATHDMANHLAVLEMFYKNIESGVVYPRWLADANHGYGIPLMNFYPPGFYFIASAIQPITRDWANTMLVVSILLFVGSGMAFYALARAFLSRLASALSAFLFMMFPYHVLDLYWRGAMAELLGFIFIPLIMYFAYRLGTEGRLKYYAGMGLCYGLYLISHMPVGYLFSYALAAYVVAWTVMSRQIKIALRLVTAMLLGLALGAPYWLPAVLEGKYAQEQVSELHPYMDSFLGWHIDAHPFYQSLYGQFFLLVATLIVASVFVKVSSRRLNRDEESSASLQVKTQSRLWMLLGFGAAFMSTYLSAPVSKFIPKIEASTPAWRWLTVSSVFACLLVGLALDRMMSRLSMSRKRLLAWRSTIIAFFIFNVLASAGSIVGPTIYQEPQWVLDIFLSRSFNPIDSEWSEYIPDMPLVAVTPREVSSEVEAWKPEYRKVRLQLKEESAVRLRTYYFPGWAARVDGQAVPMKMDEYGAQVIMVPAGAHTLESYFGTTPPRTAANTSFALAFLIIIGLSGTDYFKNKRRPKDEQPISNQEQPRQKAATGGDEVALGVSGESDVEV